MRNKFTAALFLTVLALCSTASAGRWACPLWIVYSAPDGDLYYANVFDQTCGHFIGSGYVFGDYNWPATNCPHDCVPLAMADGGTNDKFKSFVGLERPISIDYSPLDMMPPDLRDRTRILSDPSLAYIEFRDTRGHLTYAKVFTLVTNPDSKCDCDEERTRLLYVAYQVAYAPDDERVIPIECEPVFDESECHAYSGTYAVSAGSPISILILTAHR